MSEKLAKTILDHKEMADEEAFSQGKTDVGLLLESISDVLQQCLSGLEDREKQIMRMAKLLLESRDALPAISDVSARLHKVDLSLADRIEKELEPWLIEEKSPERTDDVASDAK